MNELEAIITFLEKRGDVPVTSIRLAEILKHLVAMDQRLREVEQVRELECV